MSRRASAVRAALRGRVRRARPASTRSKRTFLRSWQAIVVTLGLLIAQGPMLAHMLLVRHVTCEHGELVDRGSHAQSHDTSAEEGASGDRATKGSGEESSHDHCDALALRHRPTAMGIVVGPATLLEVERPAMVGEGAEQRPVPLLSLAPKGSPPVV